MFLRLLTSLYVYVWGYTCAIMHVWRPKDHLKDYFYHVGSRVKHGLSSLVASAFTS